MRATVEQTVADEPGFAVVCAVIDHGEAEIDFFGPDQRQAMLSDIRSILGRVEIHTVFVSTKTYYGNRFLWIQK
mgnify:CR=1 FL=1